MKKVISFDLDGTLVNAAYGNLVWLQGVPERYAERYGLSVEEAKRAVKEEYDSIGEESLLWYDLPYWLDRFDLAVSASELLDEYEKDIQLQPNATEVIDALSSRYTLVVASNAARIFVEKELGQTGLAGRFDRVFSATSDFGMVKKQEEFYRKVCDLLGVSPSEVVHVGDHEVFDVEVPLSVGMDAYHYSRGSRFDGRSISDFKELWNCL
jgi:HAD superfamily hydrolase (TIGR01493 family)